MTDFGITKTMIDHLQHNTFIAQTVQGIYTALPVEIPPPTLQLELVSAVQGFGGKTARALYKINIRSTYHGLKEIQDLMTEVISSLEGAQLKTEKGLAYFRLEKAHLQEASDHTTRLGCCVFEILIRFYPKKREHL